MLFISLLVSPMIVMAQEAEGNISISAIQLEDARVSKEAAQVLETKMQRLIQNNGLQSGAESRFIMTSKMDVSEKDITSQGMVLQKMDLTFYILDVVEDKVFGMETVSITGVGETETKAIIKGLQNVRTNNSNLGNFISRTKSEIVAYFRGECSNIIEKAEFKAKTGDFPSAYNILLTVPSICTKEYELCCKKALEVYELQRLAEKEAINKEGLILIQKAKSIWAGRQSYDSAAEALDCLSKVDPNAECRAQADQLVIDISNKLRADEKARLEFELKQYNDKVEMAWQKQADRSALLNSLFNRFGKVDINVQKEKIYRIGKY